MNEKRRNELGIEENKPTEWFETLYSDSNEKGKGVPWANMAPHPIFKNWITENPNINKGKTALVIGCGMGDDAIELESQGFEVTAFDVSESAIELCKTRFPNSEVKFIQADLIEGISDWHRKFDFVLEIFTIQALPPKYEGVLIRNISDFVSNEGKLLVVTEIQQGERMYKNGPPWLLNQEYIRSFEACGLKQIFHSSATETEFTLDRSKMSHLYAEEFGCVRKAPRLSTKQTLDIYVDKSVIEIFINGGKHTMTSRFFIDNLSTLSIKGYVKTVFHPMNAIKGLNG